MEKSNQNFLTVRQKKWAIICALIFSVIVSIMFNSKFLQADMKGTWIVSKSSIDYGFKTVPKEVTITPSQVEIDREIKIPISYGSKSSRSSIVRRNLDEGNIVYSFYDKEDSSNDYTLIYNRKHPDVLILMMKKSEDDNGDEINLFMLERKTIR